MLAEVSRVRLGLVAVYGRWSNSSAGDDKVIAGAHAADCFHNVLLIVGDDLYTLQLDAEGEAELGQEGGVGVDGLQGWTVTISPFILIVRLIYVSLPFHQGPHRQ